MKSEISALVDDETGSAEAAEQLLQHLGSDGSLRETWGLYHLIGDSLRGTAATGMAREGFARQLAAEPTVLAPRAAPARVADRKPSRPVRWLMPMAASIAAIAFVGWAARSMLPAEAPFGIVFGPEAGRSQPALSTVSTPVASAPEAATVTREQVTAPAPTAPVVSAMQLPPAGIPLADGVDKYLWAHQRFAPATTMHGIAPYVRLVTDRQGEAQR